VNPAKPIILTLNGQNQEEMSQLLVRKNAELPYLAHRLIVHVDCNDLTPTAKRGLFVSNREGARRGTIYDLIQQEIVKALKTDDDLNRLNNEARLHSHKHQDESAMQQVRLEVADFFDCRVLILVRAMEPQLALKVQIRIIPLERINHDFGHNRLIFMNLRPIFALYGKKTMK
jgi:hypothetical protein